MRIGGILLFVLLMFGSSAQELKQGKEYNVFCVAFYNLENLYDTIIDPDPNKVLQDDLIISKTENLIRIYQNNKSTLYPIMRNYSINDFYSIKKNILFAPLRYTFGNSVSVTTDSKYMYIILTKR